MLSFYCNTCTSLPNTNLTLHRPVIFGVFKQNSISFFRGHLSPATKKCYAVFFHPEKNCIASRHISFCLSQPLINRIATLRESNCRASGIAQSGFLVLIHPDIQFLDFVEKLPAAQPHGLRSPCDVSALPLQDIPYIAYLKIPLRLFV